MIILFKYCTDVENCKSSKGFSYIYIYIYIFKLVADSFDVWEYTTILKRVIMYDLFSKMY